jgi:pimeloyl-ACP methyl ester carboxylesterase
MLTRVSERAAAAALRGFLAALESKTGVRRRESPRVLIDPRFAPVRIRFEVIRCAQGGILAMGASNRSARRRLREFLALLLTVLVAGGTWSTSLAASTPAAATPVAGEARFETAACPVEVPAGEAAECGYLTVPETRSGASGRTIRLAVMVLKSRTAEPEPDPVVYLEGGPGFSALGLMPDGIDWFAPFLERRDVVLIDQRGVGFTEPRLDCPEVDAARLELFQQPDPDVLAEGQVAAALACHARLVAEGHDLGAYTSAASAADVADLVRVLGYRQVNLYGISYGTRVALLMIRDHPEVVRSAVLDSAVPPQVNDVLDIPRNIDRALEVLFAACAAEAGCAVRYPDLETRFDVLVAMLNATPARIPVTDPASGATYTLVMTGDLFVGIVFQLLYYVDAIPQLPLMIAAVEGGAYDVLVPILTQLLATLGEGDTGASFSIVCAEEIGFNSIEEAEAEAGASPRVGGYWRTDVINGVPLFAVCEGWNAPAPAVVEEAPVATDLPVLVLAGEFDPITPPAYGQVTVETMPSGTYVEFPGLGHAVTFQSPCPQGIAVAFVDAPEREPETGCVAEMTGPVFV